MSVSRPPSAGRPAARGRGSGTARTGSLRTSGPRPPSVGRRPAPFDQLPRSGGGAGGGAGGGGRGGGGQPPPRSVTSAQSARALQAAKVGFRRALTLLGLTLVAPGSAQLVAGTGAR